MARTGRTIIHKLFLLIASASISGLIFLGILKNTKQYPMIKNLSSDIFFAELKNNDQPNSSQIFSDEINYQPDYPQKPITHQPERTYFTLESLSERPLILQDVDANMLQAFEDVTFKKLILRLMINEYGDVEKVIIEEAKLSQELLPKLEAEFSRARFLPGRINGIAVPATLRIEVKLD